MVLNRPLLGTQHSVMVATKNGAFYSSWADYARSFRDSVQSTSPTVVSDWYAQLGVSKENLETILDPADVQAWLASNSQTVPEFYASVGITGDSVRSLVQPLQIDPNVVSNWYDSVGLSKDKIATWDDWKETLDPNLVTQWYASWGISSDNLPKFKPPDLSFSVRAFYARVGEAIDGFLTPPKVVQASWLSDFYEDLGWDLNAVKEAWDSGDGVQDVIQQVLVAKDAVLAKLPRTLVVWQPEVPSSVVEPPSPPVVTMVEPMLPPVMDAVVPKAPILFQSLPPMEPVRSTALLEQPAFWSMTIMLSIVSLLYIWETTVEWARHHTRPSLKPVLERILGEIAGLGFVGLVLETFVLPLQQSLAEISERFLGNEEILLESFEFLHTAFFQVGIAFFLVAGYMVRGSLFKLEAMEELEGLRVDSKGICHATRGELARVLEAPSLPDNAYWSDEDCFRRLRRQDWLDEVLMERSQRGAEALLIREYMMEKGMIAPEDRVDTALETTMARSLEQVVELSPLTWLPLIPAVALANAVDISHGVVNAASPNAADSAGFFVTMPQTVVPTLVIGTCSLLWGFWNFWKVSTVKSMVVPSLVFEGSKVRMLPPRASSAEQMARFRSTPKWMEFFEDSWAEPATMRLDQLFGAIGSAGSSFYLNSLRFQTWLSMTILVFLGTQILTRDVGVLLSGIETAGNPTGVWPEFLVNGTLFLLSLIQVSLAPVTL